MPATKSLSRLLTSPSKVAHALDWKKVSGSILSMNITSDRIDLAVASHPSNDSADTSGPQSLPSIPLKTETINGNERILAPSIAEELHGIMQDWQVCGVVVNWPVQKEGWVGAPCGKVLFTLDQLTGNKVLTANRPVCLWDEEHHLPFEDEWGRSPVYAEASDKSVHVASVEQYQAPSTYAADIWNDFCRAHWPELYYNCGASTSSATSASSSSSSSSWSGKNLVLPETQPTSTTVDVEWLDSYEDTAAYTKASAL